MGIMRFNYRSQVLGYYVDVTVALPTDNLSYIDPKLQARGPGDANKEDLRQMYKPGMKFQTVYLLHGGGDEDSLVYRYTNAELFAQRNHVMLVTPNIVHSFGADTEYGNNYATFLNEELPVVIQSLFPSSPAREDNFIMGYAMGGNAALANAIFYPERYAMCVDFSGGIGYSIRTEAFAEELRSRGFQNRLSIYPSTFGDPDKLVGSRHDLNTHIARHRAEGTELPKFIIVCGSEEFIRPRLEADAMAMKEMGLDVEYIIAEGYDHDFRMWDKYIAVALDEWLPLKRKPIYPEQ